MHFIKFAKAKEKCLVTVTIPQIFFVAISAPFQIGPKVTCHMMPTDRLGLRVVQLFFSNRAF